MFVLDGFIIKLGLLLEFFIIIIFETNLFLLDNVLKQLILCFYNME